MKTYDLVVLGAGPAGEKAAAKAAYFGKRVAIVERQPDPGGAGVHTGTLPSKTLKETALYFSGKYDKGLFGVDRDFRRGFSVDDFFYRKRYVTTSEVEQINRNLVRHKIDRYTGSATFEDQHTVRVLGAKEELIRGEFILIATGSYPYRPPHIPFDDERVHDSDSILSLKRLPKSLCVIGAGVIGCEYTTIFATMGIPVFLINSGAEILPFLDHEISQALLDQMRRDRIDVMLQTEITKVTVPTHESELLRVELKTGEILNVDMLLYAAGRSGNTASLGCEKIGVKIGRREVVEVDAQYRTSVPHIFAAGDVIGFPALASTSMDQGRAAVTHMFQLGGIDALAKIFPYGIYTVPEVSMVGLSEEDAQAKGIDCCVGRARYRDMARGKILGAQDGFLKIVFERKEHTVIGVHIIGNLATELIHYGMTLVQNRVKLEEVISVVFNYPTLHDLYKYAAYDGLGAASGHKLKD